MTVRSTLTLATAVSLAACNAAESPKPAPSSPSPADSKAIGEVAHKAYVDAINSNDLETVMADLTDDVVFQAPHEPEMVGKDAVRAWGKGYFDAYKTQWKKTSLEFVVNGDWAYERYGYDVTDTSRRDGTTSTDKGKGIAIYRKGTDGKWRIARDGWSSDLPIRG